MDNARWKPRVHHCNSIGICTCLIGGVVWHVSITPSRFRRAVARQYGSSMRLAPPSLRREVSTSDNARFVLREVLRSLSSELLLVASCPSFLSMMKASTLLLHAGHLRNQLIRLPRTALVRYTNRWPSVKEDESLSDSINFENSRTAISRNVSAVASGSQMWFSKMDSE